ncbi:hypothetical protein C0J52_22409 [Blattella germanica]|nr:hypothetical protein C0J52_22409 [Blattella germanica]
MSGHVSGLQTLIKAQYPAATFIHCYSHRFSLILSQSVNFIKETRQFFVSLNGLRAYFSHSTLRTDALRNFTEKKMPDVSPTCWNFASRLVTTVHEYRSHLVDFFVSIEDEPGDWTSEEVNMASGFVRFLSKVQTIFFLILFSKIFAFSNILFDIFQNNNMNMSYCTEKVNEFVFTLQKLRDTEFKEMWSKAVNDNQKDVDESRSKRRNCSDEEIFSRIFSEVLDTIISQTRLRFESLKQLKFVALLNCKRFDNYNENFPTDILLYELKEPYSTYFDLLALKNELKVVYSYKEFSGKSVQDIVHYMKLNDLHVVYPEVYKLATLVLTFPSSAPSVERSFSALKRIKTYLRSTQGQIHMSNLVLLSVEKEMLISLRRTNEDVFFNDVITKFISKKRRLEFICRRKENSSTEAKKGPATRKSQKEIERFSCPSLNEVMTEDPTPWVSESLPGRPSIVMPSLSVRPSLVMTSLPGPSSVDIASLPHSSSMHLNPVVAIRIVPPLAETVEIPSPQLAQSGITSSGVQNTIVGQSLNISQQNIPVSDNDTSTVLGIGQLNDVLLETNEVDLALNRLEDISNKVKQLHNREDYFDYFGKYVAALLRSLPIQKAMNMQQEVIKLILTSHTNPEVLSKELVSPLARPSLTNVTPSSETPEAVDLEERLLPAPQSLEPSSVQNVNGDISLSISQQNEKREKRPHPDDMSHKVENKHAKFCDLLEQTGEIEESLKRLENISNQINQLCGRDDHFDDFGRYSASLLRGLNTLKATEMQGEVIALILKLFSQDIMLLGDLNTVAARD